MANFYGIADRATQEIGYVDDDGVDVGKNGIEMLLASESEQ
jgi:hypothetical protein